MKRAEAIDGLRAGETLDLLVIGGGATGLGTALDAAARGHRVALVEAHDFAKGTSSRSTKLVHGGVRYLRQGNLSLVREALRERGRLARNAPHLVHPMAFVIPAYKWWDTPFYGIGLKLYDALAGKLGLGRSRMLGRDETLARIPTIAPAGLRGGVLYLDGQFDDARLAVDLARTAWDRGALLANQLRAVSLIKEGGKVAGAELRDAETGAEFGVRARVVVNATGVFVDELRRADQAGAAGIVTVSQGVHLVLPKRFLPGDAAIMVPKTEDGRVMFAVPWHERVVVGTTDTPLAAASIEPRALPEELDFLLHHARRYLAGDPAGSDVLSVFAGLRPLVRSGDGTDTAAMSRDHTVLVSESGLITVTGGKWTTYRRMGEDVIDRAEQVGGLDRRPCVTAELPILAPPQGAADPSRLPGPAEVAWFARHEMARTVEDVLARRTRCLLLDAAAAARHAREVAQALAGTLGRDEAWVADQADSFRQLAEGYRFPPAG